MCYSGAREKEDEFADFQHASGSTDRVGGDGKKLADLHALIQNADLYKTPVKDITEDIGIV